MNSKHTPDYHLGIPGLSQLLNSMIPGGLYCIQTSSPPIRTALTLQVLNAALGFGPVLVTNRPPEPLLDRSREMGLADLGQAASDKAIQVFQLQDASAKNVMRYGSERLTQELEHFKLPAYSLIVFDGADELFTLQDPAQVAEQARIYREWINQRGGCGLLVLSMSPSSAQFAAAYQALLNHLDGAVHLESGEDNFEWVVDFWRSPSGMVAFRTLAGRVDAKGTLSVSEQAMRTDTTHSKPGDVNDVFSMDSTLAGIAKQHSGKWTFSDNLVGLLHAARHASAATIVLSYGHGTELRQLAQAAHTLRVTLGKRIRIVVRELDASLRYQGELLLLRLGVNMIIHRDVPVSRLPISLESLKGQVFDRDIDVDFETALASVVPTQATGYLPPRLFIHEVAELVGRSKTLGVPYAMVRLKLPEGVSADASIGRFKLCRNGDIMTATADYLLLYLNACLQSNLLPTLRRIAGPTIEEDFPAIDFAVQEEDLANLIAQLEDHLKQEICTDQPVDQNN